VLFIADYQIHKCKVVSGDMEFIGGLMKNFSGAQLTRIYASKYPTEKILYVIKVDYY
jgi:hypothetical protein